MARRWCTPPASTGGFTSPTSAGSEATAWPTHAPACFLEHRKATYSESPGQVWSECIRLSGPPAVKSGSQRGGGPPDTRSITEDGDTVYVNVHVGGVLRSSDQGESWQPTIDIGADIHRVTTGQATGGFTPPAQAA